MCYIKYLQVVASEIFLPMLSLYFIHHSCISIFSIHLHCFQFSFQPCEQGKKLKRIHWVANIGTALKFLEGRKVRVQSLLFMFFFLLCFTPLAGIPAQLLPRGYKHWILTLCNLFPLLPRLLLSPPSHVPHLSWYQYVLFFRNSEILICSFLFNYSNWESFMCLAAYKWWIYQLYYSSTKLASKSGPPHLLHFMIFVLSSFFSSHLLSLLIKKKKKKTKSFTVIPKMLNVVLDVII